MNRVQLQDALLEGKLRSIFRKVYPLIHEQNKNPSAQLRTDGF